MNNSIKNWSIEDQPREKLLKKGAQELTESELIAVIIGSGSKQENAVEVARQILKNADNSLSKLARMTARQISEPVAGFGVSKAAAVYAALELGRRRQVELFFEKKEPINSSKQAASMIAPLLSDINHEEFWALFLNNSNKEIARAKISSGGISATVVDVRIVMKQAILNNATGLIVYHNHPGGVCQPSEGDIQTTKKIKSAAEMLDIRFLDHIIICGTDRYFSFSDEGML